jgi:guanylate kinase
MTRAVTCTTRAPRPGEAHGVDYHFLTPADFETRVEAGEFLEHATVFGNRYGTLKSEVLDRLRAGKDVLLNIDVQGAEAVRARAREVPEIEAALVTVFLTPATPEELASRLTQRGTETPESLAKRLGTARHEVARWREFQYLLVSGTMEEDQRRMEVILEAERLCAARSHLPGW